MKKTRIIIALALALGSMLALAWLTAGAHLPTARAAPLAPAYSIYYVDRDATGANDGTSWTDAFTNLQDGLNAASSGEEIWVAEGVYTPTAGIARTATFQLKDGVRLYGGFVATETLHTQRDWETHVSVLSGDLDGNDITDATGVVTDTANIIGDNAYHVTTSSGVMTPTVLDGFTITAGKADSSYPNDRGGGMFNQSSSPTLANVTFSGNSAISSGGGMFNDSSSPQLSNTTFSGNSATSSDGGGMCNQSSSPHLANVTFSTNSAGFGGGGMCNSSNSSPTLSNTTFSTNSATYYGGGMYNSSSSPQLANVTFSTNSASGGGGMFNQGSSPTLSNTTFSGNSASSSGGGGMYNIGSSPQLANVTFSGNSASSSGGGMYNYQSSSPTLSNVTFSGNSASSSGGGMYDITSSPTLANTILWGNSDSGGTDQTAQIHMADASPITVTYSLVQGGVYTGTGNISTDPQFMRDPDPGDADWTTLDDNDYGDLRLHPSSPAIDAGDNGAIPPGVTTDLDGNPRFFNVPFVADSGSGTAPVVDMGAYEAPWQHQIFVPLALRGVN